MKHREHERLKKWMKKHPYYKNVFSLGWNNIVGRVDSDPHDLSEQSVWMGVLDYPFLHGANIRHVMTGATKTTMAWALPVPKMNPVDITEWFWGRYSDIGVCLLFDNRHDWATINKNAKRCSRCRKHIRRQVYTRREWKRVELWRAA